MQNAEQQKHFTIVTLPPFVVVPTNLETILAQTAKTRGGTLEVPAVLGTKISLQQKKSGFFKNRARKGLPKSTQGIAETSLGGHRGQTSEHARDLARGS